MQAKKHILVIRFSAMGDVAMTVPVIKNLLQQNPDLHITFVSNGFFQPLFEGMERCTFFAAELKGKHKGFNGLVHLFKELKTLHKFSAVADLHNVLRSKIITTFFKLAGTKVVTIDKGRKEKALLTQKINKQLKQLKSTHQRYADVFKKLGFPVELSNTEPIYKRQLIPLELSMLFLASTKIIGVAPFAQHAEKMYPLEKTKDIVSQLSKRNLVLLFGGGKEEEAILQQWEKEMSSVYSIAGKFPFKEQLDVISNLDVMISMDSANMHMASLYGVPVVSIWGATHPFAGFYGWQQDEKNIVQVDLECRPCSVFGNRPCFRGDHACMQMIASKIIVDKVNAVIL